jgi:hypothetical protein
LNNKTKNTQKKKKKKKREKKNCDLNTAKSSDDDVVNGGHGLYGFRSSHVVFLLSLSPSASYNLALEGVSEQKSQEAHRKETRYCKKERQP